MSAKRPLRVFHGPVDIAAKASRLARAQRALGAQAESVIMVSPSAVDRPDIYLDPRRVPAWRRQLFRLLFFVPALLRYDVFHFYFGLSLLPKNLDLPILRLLGKKIVMTYCGSEVRLASVDRRRNPYSHLYENLTLDHPRYDRRKRLRMRWQGLWVHWFTALRGLRAYAVEVLPAGRVRDDIWANTPIDVAATAWDATPHEPPCIVHAPSDKAVKGTAEIEAALGELRARGSVFRYRRLEAMPHDELMGVLRDEADIVIDQIVVGDFGNVSVEAMAAGCVAVCWVVPEVLDRWPDCPVVSANAETLVETLAGLIADPERRVRLGQAGRRFVEQRCDLATVAGQLLELYAG